MSSGRRDTMKEGLTNGTMWWEARMVGRKRRKISQFPFLEFNIITWRRSFNGLKNNLL
jgi:hypothetical protein